LGEGKRCFHLKEKKGRDKSKPREEAAVWKRYAFLPKKSHKEVGGGGEKVLNKTQGKEVDGGREHAETSEFETSLCSSNAHRSSRKVICLGGGKRGMRRA